MTARSLVERLGVERGKLLRRGTQTRVPQSEVYVGLGTSGWRQSCRGQESIPNEFRFPTRPEYSGKRPIEDAELSFVPGVYGSPHPLN